MDLLYQGKDITHIANCLGHDHVQSTMTYLHLDIKPRRRIQRGFIKYMQSILTDNPKIDELLEWENEKDIMKWLDSF